ncbi:MAG: hypothetical protein AAFQ43_00455 [Bacteroidota bacterium]
MLDPRSAPIPELRDELQTLMREATPPIYQRELAAALQEVDGKARSRTYLGFVLQGREDSAPHVRDYLARCQQALCLVGERRAEAAAALVEHD